MSCRDEIQKAIEEGKLPKLTRAAMDKLVDDAERLRASVGPGVDFREAIMQKLEERRLERVEKANEGKENLLKRQRNLKFGTQHKFEHRPDKAALAMLEGGDLGYSVGGGKGVLPAAEGLYATYENGLYLKLKEVGFLEIAEDGIIDANIAQEMWLDGFGKPGDTNDPHALEIAKIFRGHNDLILADKRAAGSNVKKARGYITKTTHNREKVAAVDPEIWKQKILAELDIEKTFGSTEPEKIEAELETIYYDLATGEMHDPISFKDDKGTDTAKEMARSRKFIFKDGYSWHRYNAEFGSGNLIETLMREARKTARDTVMIEALGTNYTQGFKDWVSDMKKSLRGNDKALKRFNEKLKRDIPAAWERAVGLPDAPGTSIAAKGLRAARLSASMAKTGGAALSTVSDLGFAASRITSHTSGDNLLSQTFNQSGDFFKTVIDSDKRLEIATKLGIHLDNFQGEIVAHMGGEAKTPGVMSWAAQRFQKLNGMKYIDAAAATTTARAHAMYYAEIAHLKWDEMTPRQRLGLEKYDFDSRDWDVFKQAVDPDVVGAPAITAEKIRELTDEQIFNVFGTDGVDPNKVRFKLLLKTLAMYNESASAGASRGSPRVKHHVMGDSPDDGGWGSLRRILVQFKEPVVMNTRTLLDSFMMNPETRPRTLQEAIIGRKGDFFGFTKLFALLTTLGYVKVVLQDLKERKLPPDPFDKDTMIRSMLNGGAVTLYGDFFMKEMHRNYGVDALKLAVGPVASEAGSILDMIRKSQQGEVSQKDLFNFGWRNLPVLNGNLFYTKGAMDWWITDEFNERLNPGFKRRLVERTRETPGLLDKHQEYFMFQPTR